MYMETLLFLIEDAMTGCKSVVKHSELKYNPISLKTDTLVKNILICSLSVDMYVQESCNCASIW